jgi:hypothetical protein
MQIVGAASAAATSVAIPAHQVGDLILVFTFRDGSVTIPTKPAAAGTVPAWVDDDTTAGANLCSGRAAHFVATATTTTTGTWTNATGISVIVLRSAGTLSMGAHVAAGGTATGSATGPAITPQGVDLTSAFLYFVGHRTVTAWSAAPAGFTSRTSVATECALYTKNSTSSDGSQAFSSTNSASSGYWGITLEVVETPAPPSATSSGLTTVLLDQTGADADPYTPLVAPAYTSARFELISGLLVPSNSLITGTLRNYDTNNQSIGPDWEIMFDLTTKMVDGGYVDIVGNWDPTSGNEAFYEFEWDALAAASDKMSVYAKQANVASLVGDLFTGEFTPGRFQVQRTGGSSGVLSFKVFKWDGTTFNQLGSTVTHTPTDSRLYNAGKWGLGERQEHNNSSCFVHRWKPSHAQERERLRKWRR